MKENLPKQNPSLGINVFRHGKSRYKQEEVPIEEARDLTAEGVDDVKKSAEALVKLIKPDEEVEIWSSPMGRTLQTAKIIAQVLEEKQALIRKKGDSNKHGIKVFEQFSEVKNFSWKLFYPLVAGGEVEFSGKKFFVDKSLTNPNNLNSSQYFLQEGIKHIDLIYKQRLLEEYVREIEGFEKFVEATKRLMRPLSRLKNIKDKPYRIIIVTHDSLSGFIANVFSGGTMYGINPGEFINLERREGRLIATKVGGLENGNDTVDVVNEFNRKYDHSFLG